MVFYAFEDMDFPEELRGTFIGRLEELLDSWGFKPRVLDYEGPRPKWRFDGELYPYLEINGPHGWLTIRRLTDMDHKDMESLVGQAVEIYQEMKDL